MNQRPRGSATYNKPPLSHNLLLDRLVSRGLVITDKDRTLRYLRHIGYYRLSPYMIPFRQTSSGDALRPGTSFDDVLRLYVFDRELRLLVMNALERVEVAVRAALTDHMSTTYRDSHWYADASHFKNVSDHAHLVKDVKETCLARLRGKPDRGRGPLSHKSALEHYLTTYRSPDLPPSWLMVEHLTIGRLSKTYANLARRSDRTAVAQSVGLTAVVLESWMRTYVRVRNICAHHGRLWNVGLGVYPKVPSSPSISWLHRTDALPDKSMKMLYPVLVSLQSVLDSISPRSGWAVRLESLLRGRPDFYIRGMGVPQGWQSDGFWSSHI